MKQGLKDRKKRDIKMNRLVAREKKKKKRLSKRKMSRKRNPGLDFVRQYLPSTNLPRSGPSSAPEPGTQW